MRLRTGYLPALLIALAGEVWAQGASFEIRAIRVEGNSLLPESLVSRTLDKFKGAGRSLADVNQAAVDLKAAYQSAGYPVVQVFPPEQTVSDGTVVLRVVEGRVARVTVTGLKAYDEANIRASLPALKEGEAPNASEVVADIVLANENPAKQVAVNFQAGIGPGDVDARVDVTEDRIEKWVATLDNSGSLASGFHRVSLGYQHANIGNRDHLLSVNLNTTLEYPDKGANLTLGYHIPFYRQGMSLDLIGTYSNSSTSTTTAGNTLNFTGQGTYAGARLNYSLPSAGVWRHKVVGGLDYKDFANECRQGATVIPCGTITAQPLSLSYVFQMQTPEFQTGGSIGYTSNIAGGYRGAAQDYTAARAGATPDWSVWRAAVFVGMPLPGDWQVRATGNFQESSDMLIPSEQFGLGGASSIRSYAERAVAADYGYAANLELYTPDFGAKIGDQFKTRAVFFYDFGTVRSNTVGPPGVTLESVGFGLRLNYGKDLSVKADLGFSQTTSAFQTAGTPIPTMPSLQAWGMKPVNERWGLHFSIAYTF